MSDHVEGIVAKITSKEAGKNNNLIYNICMEVGDEDEWYGFGWDEPEFQEGDEIEFDITWNGDYPNVDPDTVNVISEGEPKPKAKSRGRSGGGRGGSSRGGSSRAKPAASRGGSSRGKPAAKPRGKPAAAKSDTMSKGEWADKDKMIRRQACMNTSIKLCTLLFAEGAVKLPTKKADQFDAVVELCNEEAERLYDQYEEQVYGKKTAKRGSRNARNDYDDDIPE